MTSKKIKKSNTDKLYENNSNSVLLIDLENIKKNYTYLKKKVKSSELGVSVKANAYGLGQKMICKTLLQLGCKTFFVATYQEGLEAVKIKKNINIYVLNGCTDKKTLLKLVNSGINIVINNSFQLDCLINVAKKNKLVPKCAIHVDTGLNRLGISIDKIANTILLAKRYLNITLIMSHLSCSENKKSKINNIQLKKFKELTRCFNGLNKPKLSLSNSHGILISKDFHFDLCRPGGLLYGLSLSKIKIYKIKNVIRLLAKVIQIKLIKKGEHVGYGATYRAKKDSVIAILGIGYADGLPRNFNGSVYFKNHSLPIIGNISMDLCTIDVSRCSKLKINDWVEVFGDSISIEDFAKTCNTISYEISSKIGNRVERIYK